MQRHFLFSALLIPAMATHALAQEAQKVEPPAKRLPVKVMQAWENAEKKVQKNREVYDAANAKVLEGFQKEVERIKPPVDVDEVVRQFQQDAIVALDANAKAPAPPPPDIGDGIVIFNGHRYKLIMETLSWDDAKKRCEDLGGHLLICETGAEQGFIHKAINELRVRKPDWPASMMVWLGLVRDEASQKWVSMATGVPQLYSNWEPGQPRGRDERSAMFVSHGRWFSRGGGQYFVVCEWDK